MSIEINNKIRTYVFYWKSGEKEILQGYSESDALNSAGYGQGAIKALDFFTRGQERSYKWNEQTKSWDMELT